IDEARQLAGLPPSQVAAAPSAATAAAGKSAPAGPAAKGQAAVVTGAKNVSGTVTLSASLAGQVKPTDAVFVFARPTDGRMPIALVRAQAKDLPLKFTLDDTQAMSPEVKISGFEQVVIAARVSKSGSAMPAKGDLEGLTPPVKVGSNGVSITIDRVLP
ncbi:MAG: c-type cytochrome biogenesis protein CcmI, partial [Burkholderiaceae bacterium]|nr:c-type cytochrome biogenesis protein CcmI [Burkholderiaceae bacterium]